MTCKDCIHCNGTDWPYIGVCMVDEMENEFKIVNFDDESCKKSKKRLNKEKEQKEI